jgi:hypothetical protein
MDRILDRHNYSAKTIEVYEIMSAYYVDIFYNHLYTEAKKLKAGGKVSSVTEGYKHTLNAFLKGLSNPNLYKKSIVGIHHYFITIGFASISFTKCVDRLTTSFVPSDYFNSLTSTQKMGVLRMVINQSMKVFIRTIVDEHMSKIIDNHKDADNVRILQDALIDCFILEREGMYQRFIASKTVTNKDDNINRLVAEKMQQEIKKLVKEKYDQKKQILILKRAYTMKKNIETKQIETISELKKQIKLLQFSSGGQRYDGHDAFDQREMSQQSGTMQCVQRPESVLQSRSSGFTTMPVSTHPMPGNLEMFVNASAGSSESIKQAAGSSESIKQAAGSSESIKQAAGSSESIKQATDVDEASIHSDDSDEGGGSNFIEINSCNIGQILNSDEECLQHMHDSSVFNTEMDEGTTLNDFA